MIESQQMKIAQLLQMTLVADTFEIRQAERKLASLYSDQNFVVKLMAVPKDLSVPFNIRKAAVLYTMTYSKNMELGKNQQKLTAISKYLFMQLAQSNLQLKLRKHLITTLSYLISLDKNSRIKSIFYEESMQNAQKVFLNLNHLLNYNCIIFVGLAIQVVLTVSVHTTKQLIQFMRNSFVYCVGIADRLYEPAEKAVEHDNRESLLEIFCIMKIYSQCIKMYLKKIAYSDAQTVKQLFEPIFCQLLGRIWDFTLKQNSISDNIIHYTRKYDTQISQQYHSIKADYTQVLSTTMRTIFQYYKDPKILSTHHIIKNKDLILVLINSIYSINLYCPHYQIHSPSLIKLMEEILNCILLAVKSNYYYDILVEKKKQLVQACIFKILDFSQDSYQLLQSDPQEFINQVFQIIDMDPSEFINNRKKQFDQVQILIEDIEDYTTLRTVAATLLSHYCKNIDGTLSDILNFICFSIKNDKKTQFSLSTLILVLGILRDQILDRGQQSMEVIKILILKLYKSELPIQIANMDSHNENKRSENLQYMMTLICIYKYISKERKKGKDKENQQLEGEIYKLNKVIVKLIEEKYIQQGVRLIAYDIVTAIIRLDENEKYTLEYIKMIKRLLVEEVENRGKKLDILYNIFKFKDDEILSATLEEGITENNESQSIIIDILEALRRTIVSQIDNQLQINKDVVCKCWNIISDICQNQKYLTFQNSYVVENSSLINCKSKMIEKISQILLNLSSYIDGKNNLQYDEYLILCLNSVLESTKTISHTQMMIFEMVPRLFYNKYSYRFQALFQTMILFLKYGPNFLNSVVKHKDINCTILQIIIQMCIKNMNRTQSLRENELSHRAQEQSIQGILLLQYIIINYGAALKIEDYQVVIMQVYQKLNVMVVLEKQSKQQAMEISDEINKQKFLIKSNLICIAGLILLSSYNLFTEQDCRTIMEQIAKNLQCVTENYNKKIIIMTFTELLSKPQLGFVTPYLIIIIKTIVKFSKRTEEVDQENFRGKSSIITKQYQNCITYLDKGIEQINEIKNAKEKITIFKQKYQHLWQNIIKQLIQQDIKNLKQLMGKVKIKNESRQIFKIKR